MKAGAASNESLPLTAMILAGGFGTRLRSVVSDRPKPLALVSGRPFLEILIESLARKGVRRFTILIGYMGEMIRDTRGAFARYDAEVDFVMEDKPLGTGGAVKNAAGHASEHTLLVNGDTFFDADLRALFDFHLDRGSLMTLSLTRVPDASRYGSVEVDSNGLITGFREKDEASPGPGLINAGMSILSRKFIEELPDKESFSMERDVLPEAVQKGWMYGFVSQGAFFDIGTPSSYEDFQAFVGSRRALQGDEHLEEGDAELMGGLK